MQSLTDAGAKEIVSLIVDIGKGYVADKRGISLLDRSTDFYLQGSDDSSTFVWDKETQQQYSEIFFTIDEVLKGNYSSRNILLSGPPGGGKTVMMRQFAKYLINKCRKTKKKAWVVIIAGSYLGQYEDQKAITLLNAIINEIKSKMKSGYIVYLGIDEAEGLLGDNKGKRSDKLIALLSGISQLDRLKNDAKIKGSYILTCTTNLPRELNEAMGRRMEIFIECALPTLDVLVQIYSKKITWYDKKYRPKSPTVIYNDFWSFLVKTIPNLMGGDIDNIVKNTYIAVQSKNDMRKMKLMITPAQIIFFAIKEYTKKLIIVGKQISEGAKSEADKLRATFDEWMNNKNTELFAAYPNCPTQLLSLKNEFGGLFEYTFELAKILPQDTSEEILDKIRELIKNKNYDITIEDFNKLFPESTTSESSTENA